MEAIVPESEQFHPIHPLVALVLEKLLPPSPGICPRDPEQPKHGCLVELRKSRLERSCSTAYMQKKEEILALTRLANHSLTPAPTGWTGTLAGPKDSPILQRRKLQLGLKGELPKQIIN